MQAARSSLAGLLVLGFALRSFSACLTSPAPRLEHGIDELEDGALVGRGKLLDAAEALEQPRGLGRERLAEGLHAEQLVGRHLEGARELDEDRAGAGRPGAGSRRSCDC